MNQEDIDHELTRALNEAQIGVPDRQLALELVRSYREGDVDWLFQQVIEARCNAEVKQALRLFRERLLLRKGQAISNGNGNGNGKVDSVVRVVLEKPPLAGSKKFRRLTRKLVAFEEGVQDKLKDGAFEEALKQHPPRAGEGPKEMIVAPWQRTK